VVGKLVSVLKGVCKSLLELAQQRAVLRPIPNTPLCRFCATGAFDGDAFMLDSLPAWTAHLEYQEICGPSPGQALH
jgi:hypothetical protein